MHKKQWLDCTLYWACTVSVCLILSGCSVYMEETRPEPTRLDQFQPGESRDDVLEKLGQPITTADHDGASCDLYQLYLSGYGQGSKAPIALVETAADVFTLGLAEIVSTPTEEMTKNQKSPVWFCYKNGSLSSVANGHLEQETVSKGTSAGTASGASVSTQSSTPGSVAKVSATIPPATASAGGQTSANPAQPALAPASQPKVAGSESDTE
jgi:hypothetical protein